MYFPTKRGANEPQNPQNHKVVFIGIYGDGMDVCRFVTRLYWFTVPQQFG